jgi:hypothetical protein
MVETHDELSRGFRRANLGAKPRNGRAKYAQFRDHTVKHCVMVPFIRE